MTVHFDLLRFLTLLYLFKFCSISKKKTQVTIQKVLPPPWNFDLLTPSPVGFLLAPMSTICIGLIPIKKGKLVTISKAFVLDTQMEGQVDKQSNRQLKNN